MNTHNGWKSLTKDQKVRVVGIVSDLFFGLAILTYAGVLVWASLR